MAIFVDKKYVNVINYLINDTKTDISMIWKSVLS